MGIFWNCCLLFPASLKLAYIGSLIRFHLLPCLTTFNIVVYLNERELNNWCGVPSIWNSLHIELHLNCSVVCALFHAMLHLTGHASYLVVHHAMFMWWLFTMLLASFRVASLVSFGFVPELWGSVRLRPFVFFMHSFFFLAGFQAKWPYPRNHFYLCLLVVRSIAMSRYLPLVISCLPCCHVKPLTHLSQQTVVWLCYRFCSAPLIALLVAGEDEVCSMLEHGYVGISQYLLFN